MKHETVSHRPIPGRATDAHLSPPSQRSRRHALRWIAAAACGAYDIEIGPAFSAPPAPASPLMSPDVIHELAPTGTLRVGINLSNFLLVTGKAGNGDPIGVAPDMGAEIARRLGVPVAYVTYPNPGVLADAADTNVWDIGLIGAEPQRAEKLAFTAAYCEIEATYIVGQGSPFSSIAEVDRPGVRIAVTGRTAYGLWLERNIKQATLVQSDTLDSATAMFVAGSYDALAGLKPRLISEVTRMAGARMLDGHFMTVQQAIGTAKRNTTGAAFLRGFAEEAKASGLVASLIAKHAVVGLSVAGPGPG
jgi:polar amino acid transport system substrate-binding protein